MADHAIETGTWDGINEGVNHLQAMVELPWYNFYVLQPRIPTLLLRLDRDQECYDFIKEDINTDVLNPMNDSFSSNLSFTEWLKPPPPRAPLKDVDVLEEPGMGLLQPSYLNYKVATLLLKVKLLMDIRYLLIAKKVTKGRMLPPEVQDLIEKHTIRSPLSSRFLGKSHLDLVKVEHQLMRQSRAIVSNILQDNGLFMSMLLDPGERTHLRQIRASSNGAADSENTAMEAMEASWPAWQEIAGARELLKDVRACAAKDPLFSGQVGCEHMSDKNRKKAKEYFSVNKGVRLYFDFAVANGSWLGPPREVPAERWTDRHKARSALQFMCPVRCPRYICSIDGSSSSGRKPFS